MNNQEIVDAIKTIVGKAKESNDSGDALRFSQAALNLAHANAMLPANPGLKSGSGNVEPAA